MNHPPGLVFQQKFSTTPGKPAGKLGLLPAGMFKNKYHVYLNLSCNWLCGGFGKVGQINYVVCKAKKT
jgi:hypothetical protein